MGTTVYYHSRDNDGFGCRFAVTTALGNFAKEINFVPFDYGDTVKVLDVSGHNVYFCDVTPSTEELQMTLKISDSVTIIDHHQRKYDELRFLEPDLTYVFDNNRSAAVLTWNYFSEAEELPAILAYVEDRDLWKWELPNSYEINYGLDTFEQTVEAWTYAAQNLDLVEIRGMAIASYIRLLCSRAIQFSHIENWGPFKVAVANNTVAWSEVGHALCDHYGGAIDFSATWYMASRDVMKWSLRSLGDFNVSDVAAAMGGGGHPNAAGFLLDCAERASFTWAIKDILSREFGDTSGA